MDNGKGNLLTSSVLHIGHLVRNFIKMEFNQDKFNNMKGICYTRTSKESVPEIVLEKKFVWLAVLVFYANTYIYSFVSTHELEAYMYLFAKEICVWNKSLFSCLFLVKKKNHDVLNILL